MHKLTFYMKSGNSFIVDGIEDWELDANNGVNRLKIIYSDDVKNRLIVPSIRLEEIEAVFREEY